MNSSKFYHDEFGRVCARCLEYKPWYCYYKLAKNQNGINGRWSTCSECHKRHRMKLQQSKKEYNFIKDKVKIKKDICPELTPEMFGIIIEKEEDLDYN